MSRPSPRFVTDSASWARLPVVIVSGFLGSGKTTLVNALLRDDRLAGTAVAVNEFGEMPLDRTLIDHGSDQTVVLANGCLCCNLAGDMEEAVMRLFTRRSEGGLPPFARLIIEPSGLSDPTPIAQSILRNPLLARALRLEGIVTTVDGRFGAEQMARHAEMRPQIAQADHLVLTKPDLVAPSAIDVLRAALRRRNPVAPITVAENGAVDAGMLLPEAFLATGMAGTGRTRSWLAAEAVNPPSGHLDGVASVTLNATRPLAWPAFEAWLRDIRLTHSERLLRVKGMMDIAGSAGPVMMNGIHHVLHAPVELGSWPAGEQRSRLVMIADAPLCADIRSSWIMALPTLLAA